MKPGAHMRHFRAEQGCVAAAAAVAVLYALTLSRSAGAGDGAELILAAQGLGIAHPPGYALWLLPARLAAALPVGTLAWRVNALSALAAAVAAGLLWLIARRAGLRPAAATVATISFATAPLVWGAAVEAEVYGIAAVTFLALALFAMRARAARGAGSGWRRDEALFFFVAGLAPVAHQTLLFPAIALAAWVLARGARVAGGAAARGPRLGARLARGLGWATAGASITLVIPIRWSAAPAFAWTDVRGLEGLADYLLRRTYGGLAQNPFRLDRAVDEILGMGGLALGSLGVLAAALAALGLFGWKRSRAVLVPVLGAALTIPAALVLLLAFTPDAEHFAQVAPFLIPAVAALALLAGSGAETLARRAPHTWRAPALAALVIGALAPVPWRFADADRSGFALAERYGRDLLASAPPGATLVLDGDNETFLAAYAHAAGARADVALEHRRGWIFGDPNRLRERPRSEWTEAAHRSERERIRRGETLCYAVPPADLLEAGVPFTQRGLLYVAGLGPGAAGVASGGASGDAGRVSAWELPPDWPRSSDLLGGRPERFDYVTRKMAVSYSDAAARRLWSRGEVREALPWFLDAARVGHDFPGARINAATALAAAGEPERALDELLAACRLAPYDPDPPARLAVFLAAAGRPRDAAVWFERAYETKPAAALAADASRAWSLAGDATRAGDWSRRAASFGGAARPAPAPAARLAAPAGSPG